MLSHGQFIIDQIYDGHEPEEEETALLDCEAIVDFIDLSGAIIATKKAPMRKKKKITEPREKKIRNEVSVLRAKKMAVTTPLIKNLFDQIFEGSLAEDNKKEINVHSNLSLFLL